MKLEDLKTLENACEVLELDSKTILPDFSCYPEKHRKALESTAKLFIIVEAANKIANDNKEWIPDWNKRSEYKYEAWFDMSSSGFRFYAYDGWSTYSSVGSRLCFISSDVCEYVAKNFIDLYRDIYVK